MARIIGTKVIVIVIIIVVIKMTGGTPEVRSNKSLTLLEHLNIQHLMSINQHRLTSIALIHTI